MSSTTAVDPLTYQGVVYYTNEYLPVQYLHPVVAFAGPHLQKSLNLQLPENELNFWFVVLLLSTAFVGVWIATRGKKSQSHSISHTSHKIQDTVVLTPSPTRSASVSSQASTAPVSSDSSVKLESALEETLSKGVSIEEPKAEPSAAEKKPSSAALKKSAASESSSEEKEEPQTPAPAKPRATRGRKSTAGKAATAAATPAPAPAEEVQLRIKLSISNNEV